MDMNIANKLTILRVLLIPVFLYLFFATNIEGYRYLACAVFIIAAVTDALDGHLARSRNLVTNFGKFADPLADKLLVAAALISLVQTNELSSIVVIIIISREFIITGFRTIAMEKQIVIAASPYGKAKTVSQMIMIPYFILQLNFGYIGVILVTITTLLTIMSAVDYIYKNIDVLKH